MNRKSFQENPNTKDNFAIAFQNARVMLGLSQTEFVKYLYDRSNGRITISKSAIESYETGARLPKLDLCAEMSKILGISLDVVYGLDNNMQQPSGPDVPTEIESERFTMPQVGKPISVKLYKYFDKLPVYVMSNTDAIPSGWALLNAKRKILVFSNATYDINTRVYDYITLYDTKPSFAMTTSGEKLVPMNLSQLMDCQESVWVTYLTNNTSISCVYDGWYQKDKTGLFLINMGTGAVLPYEGLGVTYNAYKIPGAVL